MADIIVFGDTQAPHLGESVALPYVSKVLASGDTITGLTSKILGVNGSDVLVGITDNSSNWNTAYGWGNHADAGYITSATVEIGDSITSATANRVAYFGASGVLAQSDNLQFTGTRLAIGNPTTPYSSVHIKSDGTVGSQGPPSERVLTLEGSLPELYWMDTWSGAPDMLMSKYNNNFYISKLNDSGAILAHVVNIDVNNQRAFFGGGTNPTARVDIAASTTSICGLRIRTGVAPTAPNDGDVWQDGTNAKIRIGGVTKTFTLT